MPRRFPLVLAIALVAVSAVSARALAETAPKKSDPARPAPRHAVRHWHGYGFLPGYRTPEQIAREDAWLFWRRHPGYYWYGGPGFYRGRWNGGGFGPCWTPTPIGPVWNCGK
jgi:hypothetical protein